MKNRILLQELDALFATLQDRALRGNCDRVV